MIYGLLGKTLRHSYSKIIHEWMADYTYDLYETPEEGLRDLIFRPDAGGFNVTIPYKQKVIPFCDVLSPSAQAAYFDKADGIGFNPAAYTHTSGPSWTL